MLFSYLCILMKNKGSAKLFVAIAVAIFIAAALAIYLVKPQIFNRLRSMATGEPVVSGLAVNPSRHQFPVKGIDISHHNGDIDFRKVAADSVDFVIIKATEGVTHRDSCLLRYSTAAAEAGLRVGYYHFFRFDRGGVRQGRNFLNAVDSLPTQFPLVLDFETHSNPRTDYYLVVGRLRDMVAYLQRCGRRIMVYCNRNDYETYIRGNFDDLDLWLASGRLPGDDDRRHLWQHSHNGHVKGIDTPVDINTFNGSRSEFDAWISQPDMQ